jgi:hypothetical protein
VWLAEQLEPVRRRVAIKVIKAGMDTKQVVARFESERQALALMDHPAIAKVFDTGSTLEGRPYFVMEYVAGVPITEHCDTHNRPFARRSVMSEPAVGQHRAAPRAWRSMGSLHRACHLLDAQGLLDLPNFLLGLTAELLGHAFDTQLGVVCEFPSHFLHLAL